MTTTTKNRPKQLTLDERIAEALATSDISATALNKLVGDTEWGIAHTDQALAAERTRAADITKPVDPTKSAATIQTLELELTRLRNALPQLQAKLRQAEASEYAEKWDRTFKAVEQERDKLADELSETYPTFVVKFADLMARIAKQDAEIDQVNLSAPAGESRRIACCELKARGLSSFSAAQPRLIDKLKLPDPACTSEIIYPRAEVNNAFALEMARSAAAVAQRFGSRYSDTWHEVVKLEKEQAEAKSAEIEAGLKQAEARKRGEYEQALLDNERKRRLGMTGTVETRGGLDDPERDI